MKALTNIKFVNSIDNITSVNWQDLNVAHNPFSQYAYLNSLERSQSVCTKQGWTPHHLVSTDSSDIKAIMPMYLKSHSWGEYVFDWDWANEFQQHGVDYYPKLVATTPFTPVSSNKLLSLEVQLTKLFPTLIHHCLTENIHSWHILYCDRIESALPEDVYERNTVQFHWFNRDYQTFDHFLSTFSSRKRKNTQKERVSITQQGIQIRQLKGSEITPSDLKFFYLSYQLTYLKRGHQPHLTFDFFKQVIDKMSDNIILNIASDPNEDVACALFFFDDEQLYGRYWGCTKPYKNLHFELCYYQGIEFCIKNKLKRFNPGTQGEHKIKRGFEPILTYSYHWIKHQPFRAAIKDFCKQEQQHMQKYQQQCQQALPFKCTDNQD